MDDITLDRERISGPVDNTTPHCVLKQLLDNINLNSNVKVRYDDGTDLYKLYQKVKSDDIEFKSSSDKTALALFINSDPFVCWDEESLDKATKSLLRFYDGLKVIIESVNKVGYITPDNIDSYDPSMLYRLCKFFKIETFYTMTMEQMANAINLLNGDIEMIRRNLTLYLKEITPSELVSVYTFLNRNSNRLITDHDYKNFISEYVENKKEIVVKEKIDTVVKNVKDRDFLLRNYTPATGEEAVVLSGINFGINLLDSDTPISDYLELKRSVELFVPKSALFAKRYILNREFYKLENRWVPDLRNLYSQDLIENLALFEGWNNDGDVIEFLDNVRKSYTFYHGVHPYAIKDKDDKIEGNITYGCEEKGEFVVLSEDDLISMIRNYGFRTPNSITLSGNVCQLTSASLRKLLNICRKYDLNRLLEIIKTMFKRTNIFSITRWNLEYTRVALILLYELSLYMRGWKLKKLSGKSSELPPLKKEDTLTENFDQLQLNVNNAVDSLYQHLDKDLVLKNLFLNLCVINTNMSIYEAIEKIVNGTYCIRMMSNYLLSTVHHYCSQLNLPLPFDDFDNVY